MIAPWLDQFVTKEAQAILLARLTPIANRPFMVADGIGVDSTAHLILLAALGIRPDAILFADTGSEKDETYRYIDVRRAWLKRNNFPDLTIVRYVVSDFKHWPPYASLSENCLTNGTLPSLAFGFKSCSLKWKVAPQNAWTNEWDVAKACWAAGGRVLKAIGYDASPKDQRRYAQAVGVEDPLYEYVYSLMLAGWDRTVCEKVIRFVGEEVPAKSACWMCPASQPEELRDHNKKYLRWIVVMEARAMPRLEGHIPQAELDRIYLTVTLPKWVKQCDAVCAYNATAKKKKALPKKPRHPQHATGVLGLWRRGRKGTRGGKKMPGMMTEYIREHHLLPSDEIDALIASAPKEILENQAKFAQGLDISTWHEFMSTFVDNGDLGVERPEAVELGTTRLRKAKTA